MRCLKPKVGSITVMEDIPEHLPDTKISKIDNIIDGPHVLPLWWKKWDVHGYFSSFPGVIQLNREHLKKMS